MALTNKVFLEYIRLTEVILGTTLPLQTLLIKDILRVRIPLSATHRM